MKPANRITEENLSQPVPERQSLIDIDGQKVWIDNDFIDLIRALNEAGLKTRSHCAGHGRITAETISFCLLFFHLNLYGIRSTLNEDSPWKITPGFGQRSSNCWR